MTLGEKRSGFAPEGKKAQGNLAGRGITLRFAGPRNAFRATRGAKPVPFSRRRSTGEFGFNAAQKVVFWPLFGFDWGSFALKDQFVFGVLKC
jgi:hypothetical protein